MAKASKRSTHGGPPRPLHVRLVPRPAFQPVTTLSASAAEAMDPGRAHQIAPDPRSAQVAARRAAADLGLAATVTAKNRVTSRVTPMQLENLFGVSPVTSRGKESHIGKALVVPEVLQDTIEFAYVPSPPEFFALHPFPPTPALEHLRLDDVGLLLGANACHRQGWTGKGVRVAMTDTGFAAHPYFTRNGFRIRRVHTPLTSNPLLDASGHGTGESANVFATAPDVDFIGVKHDDYSAMALETALAESPHVVTNSWGWNIDSKSMDELKVQDPNLFNEVVDIERIVNEAIAAGVVMIFAGGNGHLAFPACIPGVIAIGGVTVRPNGSQEASSYASSFRSKLFPGRTVPDVCGVVGELSSKPMHGHVMLPVPNGANLEDENIQPPRKVGWGIFSGTSAAAPQVAGVVALMLNANPTLKPGTIKALLMATATDVTAGQSQHGDTATTGFDLATGAGLVNALDACVQARQLSPS